MAAVIVCAADERTNKVRTDERTHKVHAETIDGEIKIITYALNFILFADLLFVSVCNERSFSGQQHCFRQSGQKGLFREFNS